VALVAATPYSILGILLDAIACRELRARLCGYSPRPSWDGIVT
jgi:hypothetical protein